MEEVEINDLTTRMDQIESKLDNILKVMLKIDLSIFGDPSINFLGIIKTQSILDEKVNELAKKIEEIETRNEKIDTVTKSKRDLTDDVEKWIKRAFWGTLLVAAVVFLITGKIGIAEMIRF